MVQKYIEKPLLIDGRKFDIRSYCLITPDHKVHMYKHSYIRTSSTAFDLTNLEDRCLLLHTPSAVMPPC